MSVLDDGLGLIRMIDVVLQALFEIGEIFLYLDIVVVRDKLALHKPCFLRVLRGNGNTV